MDDATHVGQYIKETGKKKRPFKEVSSIVTSGPKPNPIYNSAFFFVLKPTEKQIAQAAVATVAAPSFFFLRTPNKKTRSSNFRCSLGSDATRAPA